MQTLYGKLADYYDQIISSQVNTGAEIKFLTKLFTKYNIESVLDIACGTGRHSIELAKKGFRVTGIDYSQDLIKVAREKSSKLNVSFIVQDVTKMHFKQKYDAAICMWSTFAELPYKLMLRQLKDALNRGGIFIIDSHFYPDVPVGIYFKSSKVTLDNLKLETKIKDIFKDKKRTRQIEYYIDSKVMKDVNKMDVLTRDDYITLLKPFDFIHKETYYDYKKIESKEANRLQLIFQKI